MLREFGALSAPIIHMLSKLDELAPEDMTSFLDAWIDTFNPLTAFTGGGVPFKGKVPLPIPTFIGKLMTELGLNYDSFRGRDIIPEEFATAEIPDQYDENVSHVARRLGEWFNQSPFKMQHILSTGIFNQVLLVADAVIRAIDEDKDVEAEEIAAQLEEYKENFPDAEAVRERNILLNSLSPDMTKRLDVVERQPKPEMPVLQAIWERFYKRSGGQIYRSSRISADKKFDISPEQTATERARIAKLMPEIKTLQEDSNRRLLNPSTPEEKIGHQQWLEERRLIGTLYAMNLKGAAISSPRATHALSPEEWADYKKHIYTLGGSMRDRRSEGQILIAGLNAIAVPELSGGIDKDWEEWYRLQDDYLDSLSEKQKGILEAEQDVWMTPMEREKDADFDVLRKYFKMGENTLENQEEQLSLYRKYRKLIRTRDRDYVAAFLKDNVELQVIKSHIDMKKDEMREEDCEVDRVLKKWGFTQVYWCQDNILAEIGRQSPVATTP